MVENILKITDDWGRYEYRVDGVLKQPEDIQAVCDQYGNPSFVEVFTERVTVSDWGRDSAVDRKVLGVKTPFGITIIRPELTKKGNVRVYLKINTSLRETES